MFLRKVITGQDYAVDLRDAPGIGKSIRMIRRTEANKGTPDAKSLVNGDQQKLENSPSHFFLYLIHCLASFYTLLYAYKVYQQLV